MATLTLTVPDRLLRSAKARLGKRGPGEIKEFLLSAIEALALEGTPVSPEERRKLMEGVRSPARRMTDADWDALMRRARGRKDKG